MVEEAEHITAAILPHVPYRQWVLTLPYALRYLLAWNAQLRSVVHQALMRAITKHYQRDAELQKRGGGCVIGAISVAQRFSSDLKLNLHWHLLLADGVWQERDGQVKFYPAEPLETMRVQETLDDAVLRITKALTRRGWQDRDDDPFAEQEPGLSALWRAALLGKPIDPATEQPKRAALKKLPKPDGRNCARYLGFSLHANTTVGPAAHDDRYRLVKYLCRPSVSAQRVQAQPDGRYELTLKTPWRDGTQAIHLTALELTGRLAALMPLPGKPTVRYLGAFAPNHSLRKLVVKAGAAAPRRRKDQPTDTAVAPLDGLEAHLRSQLQDNKATSGRLSWAAAMKACWKVDMLVCECGGKRSLVSLIQQPAVIKKILVHLKLPTELHTRGDPPVCSVRGPPGELFPWDVSETGELLLEADEGPPVDAVDYDPDLPFFDDDLAA
jgi:hypothetical protein